MSRENLMAEVQKLRDAIRSHRDTTRHELCWHHPELWGLLPEKTDPVPIVPDWPEFFQGCIRYRQSLDEQAPSALRTNEPYNQNLPKQRVMPTLRMTDYANSKAFYVEGLGFRIDWEHRFKANFPVFMQISRDGLAFFLTEHTGDCPVGGLIQLYVPDVDAWFAEFQGRGVPVKEPPNERLQGLRSMTILDPDGNKLMISTRLEGWRR